MGRQVYIDLGANHGNTVANFVREDPEFIAFAFEPAAQLAHELRERFSGAKSRVHVMEYAAWIYDGVIPFYSGIQSDQSSTLLQGKLQLTDWQVDYSNSRNVQCIDFVRWFRENMSKDDKIVLKMDIEGAEYSVLKRMLDTDAMKMLRLIRVEWHWNRYPSVNEDEHNRVRNLVKDSTKLEDWG